MLVRKSKSSRPRTTLRAAVLAAAAAAAIPAGAAKASGAAFLSPQMTVDPPAGARGLCQRYDWACANSRSETELSKSQIDHAIKVNRKINRRTREISDQAQYGRAEQWSLPTRRGGDCEDFALAKKRALVAAGLPAERLMLASVLDRRRNPHAVLILRTRAGDLVLDNLTDRVLNWRQTGYSFLRMQHPDRPQAWAAVLAGGVMKG